MTYAVMDGHFPALAGVPSERSVLVEGDLKARRKPTAYIDLNAVRSVKIF